MAASFSLTHQPKLSISSPVHKNMIFAKSQNQNSFVNITSPTKINHHQKQIMHPLLWCNSSSSSYSPKIITALNSSPTEKPNTNNEDDSADDSLQELELAQGTNISQELQKRTEIPFTTKVRVALRKAIWNLNKLKGDSRLWLELVEPVKLNEALRERDGISLWGELKSIISFIDKWSGDSLILDEDIRGVISNVEEIIKIILSSTRNADSHKIN
ncbi:unnamed protein product [Amaranthus hypochondriacus]